MWGFGDRWYWGRKEKGKVDGIVVVFAWMSSKDKNLKNYIDLYTSFGWNSLVCHPQFINLFRPDKAASLALVIVNQLVQELKLRPAPVVLASFSGGPKACMYKVIQIIEGKCDGHANKDDYSLVRDCVSGHIFDSSPVDFVSEIGVRLFLHPTVLKMSRPPRLASWIAHGAASGFDSLFLSNFESQRAEYWQTLYSTAAMGAPYLIFCSEDDDLAPFQVICNFSSRIKQLGGEVKVIKWKSSSHVGHFRRYPEEYSAGVAELLGRAAVIYSQRIRQREGEKMSMEGGTHCMISDPLDNLRKAAASTSGSFNGMALDLNDHFLIPSPPEYHEDRSVGSVHQGRKQSCISISSPPQMNPNGVLGQILFDACVPEAIEDWDLRSSQTLGRARFGSRHSPFNPIKCIRRSRL